MHQGSCNLWLPSVQPGAFTCTGPLLWANCALLFQQDLGERWLLGVVTQWHFTASDHTCLYKALCPAGDTFLSTPHSPPNSHIMASNCLPFKEVDPLVASTTLLFVLTFGGSAKGLAFFRIICILFTCSWPRCASGKLGSVFCFWYWGWVSDKCVSCLVVSNSLQPVTVAYQAPLSMEFPRQENCNGLPCPPPGDLSDPGIKSGSPTLQADSLPFKPSKKPNDYRHFLPPPSRGCSLKDASLAKWWHSLVLGGGYALVYIFFLPSSLCVITQNN